MWRQNFLRSLVLLCCFVGGKTVEERQACADSLANCADYGQSACTQYQAWAQHNCQKFCGFCTGGGQSTGSQSTCVDVVDNCAALGPNVCQTYVDFVSINCQKTCNLCGGSGGGASQCQDKLNNCADYGPTACTGVYGTWAKDNCAKTCHLCTDTGSGGSGTISGHSDVCFYKGQAYKEGQQWQDGCDKNCTCVDQRRGYYTCQSVCQTYSNLPADCHMVTPPGECCAKPQCPPRTGCQYKGQAYQQGQQWKDGCDYLCTCKDGQSGYYECRALCIQWNLLPSCHLDNPAPGKCCKTPNCPANVQINYPEGYVAM